MLLAHRHDECVVRAVRVRSLHVPQQSRFRGHGPGPKDGKQSRVRGSPRGRHLYPTTCTYAAGDEENEVGLGGDKRDKRLTRPDFFSFLPHVSHVGRPWKEP